MQATILSSTLAALIGCSTNAPTPVTPPMSEQLQWASDCKRYAVPDVRGYCLMKVAAVGHGPETADEVCGDSGTWESDCRQAWATSRAREGMTDQNGKWIPSEWSTEDLIAGCAGNEDCRFAILDARPSADPVEQIRLCREHAGKYALDCAMHALGRWTRGSPDAESVKAVAHQPLFPDETGRYVAISVACRGIGSCAGNEDMVPSCKESVASIRNNPDFCLDWEQDESTQQTRSPQAHGTQ